MVEKKGEKISYVVQETYPGRDVDFLLDPEGVPGIRIEVYGDLYFGFVGRSVELCRSWLCHLRRPFRSGRDTGTG